MLVLAGRLVIKKDRIQNACSFPQLSLVRVKLNCKCFTMGWRHYIESGLKNTSGALENKLSEAMDQIQNSNNSVSAEIRRSNNPQPT